jgi:hypothetical protein
VFREMSLQLVEHFAKLLATLQEHFIAYYKWREVVKIFRSLMSPYGLATTMCNIILFPDRQNWGSRVNLINILDGAQYHTFSKTLMILRNLRVVWTGSGVHPTYYLMVTRRSFLGGKAAGAWSWQLTSSQCRGQENVNLYMHSPHTP